MIAITQQDNGEFAEEIAHRDWVEIVDIEVDEAGPTHDDFGSSSSEGSEHGGAGSKAHPRSEEADRGGQRGGRPVLTKPERLVSADPVPDNTHPSDLEDPVPGTLPSVTGPPARRERSR